MKRPRSYLFRSRKQSTTAGISCSMGAISLISCLLMYYKAYQNGGKAQLSYAAVVFVCLVFSLIGMVLAILSRREPDRVYFFSYLGMILNGLVLVLCFVTMYLGLA